jgi:hypothetical protein
MFQEKFMMRSGIGRTSKIVLEPLMELMLHFQFLHQNKYHIFVEEWIVTQNVMIVCDFHMRFTFVCAGWEGNAHDTRIFLEAIRKEELRFPPLSRGLCLIRITIMKYT